MPESNQTEPHSVDSELAASIQSLELSSTEESLIRGLNLTLAENQLSTVLKNSGGEPLGVLVNPDEFNVLMHIAKLARVPDVLAGHERQAQEFVGASLSNLASRFEISEINGDHERWTTIDEAFGEEDT